MASKMEMAVNAAKELNEKLNMNPPILTKAKKVDEIVASMREELPELYDSDKAKISEETWKFATEIAEIKVIPDPADKKGTEQEQEQETEKPKKAGKTKADKPVKAPKEKKGGGNLKGPGVIKALLDMLQKTKKGLTKAEMLEELVRLFPDRNADSMKATINVQIPGRMAKEKGVTINTTKDKDGTTRYLIGG